MLFGAELCLVVLSCRFRFGFGFWVCLVWIVLSVLCLVVICGLIGDLMICCLIVVFCFD